MPAILLAIVLLPPVLTCAAVCVCARLRRSYRPSDCLIVLGARVRPDGTPSHTLENRCRAALEVWRREQRLAVIVCGGRGEDEPATEASVMRGFLVKAGVPAAHIFSEDTSTNTLENLRNARRIMEARGLCRAAVITSDYHLTRALWIAGDLGIEACGVPAAGSKRCAHVLKSRIFETASWFLYLFRKINRKGRIS